jgi:hypothetical protein
MKKKFLSIAIMAVMAIGTSSVFAQDARFSVGAELALPMGDFGDAVGTGFGGSLRYESPIGDNLGFTITAGYLSFSGKDFDFGGTTVTGESTYMIPIQAGLKYYFTDQQDGFYGQAELGVHMYKATEVTIDLTTGSYSSEDKMKAAFSYAPELGYHLANVDIGLRYQMVSTEGDASSYLGLRLAYVFGEQ